MGQMSFWEWVVAVVSVALVGWVVARPSAIVATLAWVALLWLVSVEFEQPWVLRGVAMCVLVAGAAGAGGFTVVSVVGVVAGMVWLRVSNRSPRRAKSAPVSAAPAASAASPEMASERAADTTERPTAGTARPAITEVETGVWIGHE